MQCTLPSCAKCGTASYAGFNEFQRNKCMCNLGINDTTEKDKDGKDISETKGNSFFVKNINSENSSQESKSGDDQKLFKPKFGRVKNVIDNIRSRNVNPPPKPEISEPVDFDKEEEENRAHKSNVAKLTFKTAKEQLLASNPAAKRTLGTSRKAQAKFVSPMIGAQ